MNKYRVYWVLDKSKYQITEAETSFEARQQFRDEYNIRNNADVPVVECVAIRLHY